MFDPKLLATILVGQVSSPLLNASEWLGSKKGSDVAPSVL